MRGQGWNRSPGGTRRVSAVVAAAAVVTSLAAGCSSSDDDQQGGGAAPASAAVAPATTVAPAGTVSASGPVAAAVADPAGGGLALLDTDRTTLRLRGGGRPDRTVTLPAPAAALAPGAPGRFLVAAGQQFVDVGAATGDMRATDLDGQARAVTRRPDGSVAVGLADGRVEIRGADGRTRHTVSELSGVDEIAAAGDAVAVLDRAQTSLSQLDLADGKAGLALRAGTGATNVVADHFGRLLVTDTASGALLVYTAEPLVLRQRFPVGSSPYALAYDQRSETVWVTLTASNEVVGFDLSTGIPEEVGRFATVRQPNAVTIDERTGEMFVASATGDGLQRIGADERKRGQ